MREQFVFNDPQVSAQEERRVLQITHRVLRRMMFALLTPGLKWKFETTRHWYWGEVHIIQYLVCLRAEAGDPAVIPVDCRSRVVEIEHQIITISVGLTASVFAGRSFRAIAGSEILSFEETTAESDTSRRR